MKNSKGMSMAGLEYLVLEECDRILDIGFKKEMDEIVYLL
jgi:superfamily II DNA/RNA helicase